MIRRNASKRVVKEYLERNKQRYRRIIRFARNFDSYQEAESCFLDNLNDKFKSHISKDVYMSYNFKYPDSDYIHSEILAFYRHPSKKYKDILLMKMVYPIDNINNSKSFIGGKVSYVIMDNELRK